MNDDFPILAAVAANPTHPYALLEHLRALGLPPGPRYSEILRAVRAARLDGLPATEEPDLLARLAADGGRPA